MPATTALQPATLDAVGLRSGFVAGLDALAAASAQHPRRDASIGTTNGVLLPVLSAICAGWGF